MPSRLIPSGTLGVSYRRLRRPSISTYSFSRGLAERTIKTDAKRGNENWLTIEL